MIIIQGKSKYILPYLVIILGVTALFLPAMVGWKGIFHNDQAMEEFPRYYFVAQNFQRGIIPLWDPQTWCGAIPFYARYYADTYYVPLWPFYFLANLNNLNHSYWTLILIPLWLHYILAAAGMYFLLHRIIGLRRIASCFGAMLYIYSPTFSYANVWQQVIGLEAWLPWLISTYILAVRKTSGVKILLSSCIFWFILTCANPAYLPFVIFIWGGSVVFLCIASFKENHNVGSTLKPLAVAFIIFFIGTALSSVYILSFLDGIKYTGEHIELSALSALKEKVGSLPPVFLATLFLPDLFGNVTGVDLSFLNPSHDVLFWEGNLVGGMAVSFFVIFALFLLYKMPVSTRRQHLIKWFLLSVIILYIFSILCALGRHTSFYRYIIGPIPFIGEMPRPIRYRFLQCFSASVLAAFTLNYISGDSLLKKNFLRRFIRLFVIIASLVIMIGIFYPFKKQNEISYEWSKSMPSAADGYFSPGANVCMFSPSLTSKKIGIMFDGSSSGQIRYASTLEGLTPDAGILALNYSIPQKGWYEFNVDIPKHRFVWVYQKPGATKIGYKYAPGSQRDSFYYDNIKAKWVSARSLNSIWFYQERIKPKASLMAKLKAGSISAKKIIIPVLYCLFIFIVIIFGYRYLPLKGFIYVIGIIALAEVSYFGICAFYGAKYISQQHLFLSGIRSVSPTSHPALEPSMKINRAIADPRLRIATTDPLYDNFFRLSGNFSLMGYEMHPLESRFKQAFEMAYEQPADYSIYYSESVIPAEKNIPFLNHFSVGYFMVQSQEAIFKKVASYLELGSLYKKQGKFQEAEMMLKKAIESGTDNESAHAQLADLYRKEGRYEEAGEMFKKAAELDIGNGQFYVELGRYYLERGNNDAARRMFERALQINSFNKDAHIELGNLLIRAGKYKQAEEVFRRVIGIDPGNESAHAQLADLYRQEGQLEEAEKMFKRSAEVAISDTIPDTLDKKVSLGLTGRAPIFLDKDAKLLLYLNDYALPRVFTQDKIIIAVEKEQLRQLVSGDLRKAVYMGEATAQINKSKIILDESSILHFNKLQEANKISNIDLANPNRILVSADITIPSMLVFTEIWYPGWKAYIDRKPQEIFRVNYCQRGVWLEKGRHDIKLIFRPRAWFFGACVSLGTALVLTLFMFKKIMNRYFKRNNL